MAVLVVRHTSLTSLAADPMTSRLAGPTPTLECELCACPVLETHRVTNVGLHRFLDYSRKVRLCGKVTGTAEIYRELRFQVFRGADSTRMTSVWIGPRGDQSAGGKIVAYEPSL